MLTKWLPVALILIGAAVMVFNIYKCGSLFGQLRGIHSKSRRLPRALLAAYLGLLIVFLAGYLTVAACLIAPIVSIDNLLVALIFFLGSLFVLIGLVLEGLLTKSVLKADVETIQTLIAAVEARDNSLNGHSLHVARLTMLLYQKLPPRRKRKIPETDLRYAALLHDIGKLGIPEAILNKEGPLSAEEMDLMRQHPQIGKKILAPLDCFRDISDWVLCHHERYDGTGYLKKPREEIPFASMLISVADTYSALTTTRAYREAKNYEEAAAVLKRCSGTQLHPELVELFLSIPKQQVEACAESETGNK